MDLSDCCWRVNHAHEVLKQAVQDEKKEKQTQGFSRSLKSKCGKIFVELESLEGKAVRKPESALASLLGVSGVNGSTVNVKRSKLFPGVGNSLPRGC